MEEVKKSDGEQMTLKRIEKREMEITWEKRLRWMFSPHIYEDRNLKK